MSIVTSALLALTVIFVLATRQSNAIVQCLSCPPASVNLTSDAKLNTTGCTLVNGDLCVLSVQIDYSHPDQNAANFNAVNTPILVFSNDQPQLTSNAVIWFDQVRMQRVATVQCLAGTSCGVDLLQKQYSEQSEYWLKNFNFYYQYFCIYSPFVREYNVDSSYADSIASLKNVALSNHFLL